MKYVQLVIGPAGSGKSTYCKYIQEHQENSMRSCKVVNLDPAAEYIGYKCDLDVRDLITVTDVVEETDYGPNGALVFAMEYLVDHMEWLEDVFDGYVDDEYILVDCPGQIELFTHLLVMKKLTEALMSWDCRVVAVHCLDICFIQEGSKFISGILTALSSMIQLEIPHVNVLTKCDLLKDGEDELERILSLDPSVIISECKGFMPDRYRGFNNAICTLLEDYNLVDFIPLNLEDDDSIIQVSQVIESTLQYGENAEPRTVDFE